MSDEELTDIEKDIVIKSLRCLHHLKYIGDLAIMFNENKGALDILVEEVTKIREAVECMGGISRKDNEK